MQLEEPDMYPQSYRMRLAEHFAGNDCVGRTWHPLRRYWFPRRDCLPEAE